ncbi:HNH endonuclease signature motif containing protein [Agromyces sp. Marseille-P2726]|uniref:HNH endonuclease signature motif containing protein n=1 Tax=Agromyces sp. Marseille-P2726 TaxID=2709132 RepID=UPI00156E893C|nr:HNH endonuclease signature motif containing protein [Agromyces sp. Marseille-P2726]
MSSTPAALLELEVACGEVLETWAGALPGSSSDAEGDVLAMSDDGLVRAAEALARLGRRVEALQARCAAGVAERSRGGDADLARRHGHPSAERLIAQATGGRYSDAARLVTLGRATSRRESFSGENLPARHPRLAQALDGATISVVAADVIRRFLDGLSPSVARDERDAAEELLVDRAAHVGVDGVTRLVKQLEAHLDPDGVKPREDELRSRRALSVWEDASGMINLRGAFDPANGAPIKLAIETLVGAELHRARDAKRPFGETGSSDGSAGPVQADPLVAEDRTIPQMNADALADIARLSLSSADAPAALRSTVVVTRIDVEGLKSRRGHATIDGIDQPVSAATAFELIAACGITPMLVRGSEVLDLGRSSRLFSAAQKLALLERDGGCAWPGCMRPPSHTQAHHRRWWKRDSGPTDLANGIMLCTHHHHRVHDDGWRIEIRNHRSWFIPPPHLDPEQRPRPGNISPHHLVGRHLADRTVRSAVGVTVDAGPPGHVGVPLGRQVPRGGGKSIATWPAGTGRASADGGRRARGDLHGPAPAPRHPFAAVPGARTRDH